MQIHWHESLFLQPQRGQRESSELICHEKAGVLRWSDQEAGDFQITLSL